MGLCQLKRKPCKYEATLVSPAVGDGTWLKPNARLLISRLGRTSFRLFSSSNRLPLARVNKAQSRVTYGGGHLQPHVKTGPMQTSHRLGRGTIGLERLPA